MKRQIRQRLVRPAGLTIAVPSPRHLLVRGVEHHQAGRLAEAEAQYRRVLAAEPANAEALHLLGALALQVGQHAAAAELITHAIRLDPRAPAYHSNLGVALQSLGRFEEAVASYDRALALQPTHLDAHTNRGVALQVLGKKEEALASFEAALRLQPNHPGTLNNVGVLLASLGRDGEAIEAYQRSLALRSDVVDTWKNLTLALLQAGRTTEATVAFRRILELNPSAADTHSSLIFYLDHLPDAIEVADVERRRWNASFGQRWRTARPVHLNRPDAERRLRVGYVSADFREHSVAWITLPVLRSHDRSAVTVVCYSSVAAPDAVTARFQGVADVWRDVTQVSDDALTALIQADEIDVLVDLSGHSAGNRLPVFARKPAPVQVTAWGYATGTGLDAMDYFLADPVVVPSESRAAYAEEVVDLPSVVCYAPPPAVPPVVPAPMLGRGHITFGAFNRLDKVSPGVVEVWSRVMVAVPDARLILKTGSAADSAAHQRLIADLVALGVERERIEVRGKMEQFEHLAAYGEIDLLLDTFPHSGGVTTLESILMGVPTVTLLGERVAGRLSASFLTALGLEELIGRTVDEYVEIAAGVATRPAWLAELRGTLRDRSLSSPVGDARAYTRAVEMTYQKLWQRWCEQSEPTAPLSTVR